MTGIDHTDPAAAPEESASETLERVREITRRLGLEPRSLPLPPPDAPPPPRSWVDVDDRDEDGQ